MRAIVVTRLGPPGALRLQQAAKPAPRPDEVLIRVHAATVTAGDVVVRRLPFLVWLPLRLLIGLHRQRIPGHELAGVIESIGSQVTRFQPSDGFFGTTAGRNAGDCAEYVSVPETRDEGVLATIPQGVS